jgi:recombination protein RecT
MSEVKAVSVKEEVLDKVLTIIRTYQQRGELQLPANYSVENAMKSAWLILQGTKDRNGKPVLEACTRPSIANTLTSMAIQGLNPDKKQCYFIAYGTQLTLMRSYFGDIAVAKRVDPTIVDIYAEVVYQGDEFEYTKYRGQNYVSSHKSKLQNVDKTKIIAAYAIVMYDNDRDPATIMTMDEIKVAWAQSQLNPVNADGNIKADTTHGRHTAEMAKKTVLHRACKAIINSSNDNTLFTKTVTAEPVEIAAAEVATEIEEQANAEYIDIPIEQPVADGKQASFVSKPSF